MDVHVHVTSTHQPQPAGPARSEQPHHTDARTILSRKRLLNRRSQARYRQNLVVRAPFIYFEIYQIWRHMCLQTRARARAHTPLCRNMASRVSIGT